MDRAIPMLAGAISSVLFVCSTLPMLIKSGRAARATTWLLVACVALSVVALLLHVVGLSRQTNMPVVGLVLLPAVALLVVSTRMTRER